MNTVAISIDHRVGRINAGLISVENLKVGNVVCSSLHGFFKLFVEELWLCMFADSMGERNGYIIKVAVFECSVTMEILMVRPTIS